MTIILLNAFYLLYTVTVLSTLSTIDKVKFDFVATMYTGLYKALIDVYKILTSDEAIYVGYIVHCLKTINVTDFLKEKLTV